MINLTTLSRIRLRGGRLVHAVNPGRPMRTACGKPVKLQGPTGWPYDEPLPDRQAVTCPRCSD